MAKEKVTRTLDTANLAELRSLVGSRSLSAAVDAGVGAYLARMRHLVAVDDLLAELERKHGAVPAETLDWAATLVKAVGVGPSAGPTTASGLMLLLDRRPAP